MSTAANARIEEIGDRYAPLAVLLIDPHLFWKPTRQQAEVLDLLAYIDTLQAKVKAQRVVNSKLFDEVIELHKRAA